MQQHQSNAHNTVVYVAQFGALYSNHCPGPIGLQFTDISVQVAMSVEVKKSNKYT